MSSEHGSHGGVRSEHGARGVSIQACKHCGSVAAPDAHFCPKCDKILAFVRHGDYFAFLGLPRKLRLDSKDLDRRLRALTRQFHPDYYCNATPAERVASLERSSYLNDAYRTLRDPSSRIEYLLHIEGIPTANRQNGGGVPAELLEEVFTLNEELDAIREARASGVAVADVQSRIAAARRPVDERLAEHRARLEALTERWDEVSEQGASAPDRRAVLESLKTLLLEKNYLENAVAAIERETSVASAPNP